MGIQGGGINEEIKFCHGLVFLIKKDEKLRGGHGLGWTGLSTAPVHKGSLYM